MVLHAILRTIVAQCGIMRANARGGVEDKKYGVIPSERVRAAPSLYHICFSKSSFLLSSSDTSGDYLCKFITGGVFIWLSAASSGILLIAIAAARYFAVVHPLRRKFRLNNKRVLWIMAISWGFACLLTAPSMSAIAYDAEKDFCVENYAQWYPKEIHVAFVFAVNCMVPIISMTLLYARIIYKLWRNQEQVISSVQSARLKARKRVTIMLIIVTLVHTLCWSPNYVLYLLIFFVPGFHYGSTDYIITVLLVLLNAAADPLLYTRYMDGFRRGMRSVLCCCHRNTVHVVVVTPSGRKIDEAPGQRDVSNTGSNNEEAMETSNF